VTSDDVRQAVGRKIIAESLSQHDEKHVVPTPLSEIRVGRRRFTYICEKLDSHAVSVLGVRSRKLSNGHRMGD
jgi:hypothetical protein